MRGFTATVAVLVVAASLVAAIPAEAVGDRTPADATGTDPLDANATGEIDAQSPPELPEQWRQTYGADGDDIFSDLVRTDDGGYLIVGWTERETTDGWVMKVDGDGEREWERTIGGSGTDRFWGLAETDEGYLLAGRTTVNGTTTGWVVEVDSDGEVREERTTDYGAFNAITRDDAGGYLLVGWTAGGAAQALKLDDNLSREWHERYQTPDGYQGGFLRAVVPAEDGYYLGGKAEGDSDDAWALKVDSAGDPEWQTTVGGPNRDDAWAAVPVSSNGSDDGFVLAGETGVDTDSRDGWLVKFDADGSVAWERTPGSEGAMWFDSAMKTEDGFLFTGSANDGPTGTTEGYVLKTDDNGTAEWDAYYGTQGWDKPWPAIRAHGGGYLLAGQTGGDGATGMDGWLVRIGADSGTTGTDSGTVETTTTRTEAGNGNATDTTASAIQGESDATTTTDSQGSVPGFGIVATLVALVALATLARRE